MVHPPNITMPSPTTPTGPMTRGQVKAMQEKVRSFLAMCGPAIYVNAMLPQEGTLLQPAMKTKKIQDLQ